MALDRPYPREDKTGGIETTPGVVDPNHQPINNHRPGFASSPNFIPVPVPGIEPRDFKFYRSQEEPVMATRPLMLGVLFAGLLTATPGQAASNLDCIAVGGESGIAALEGLHSAAPGFTSMRCTSRECVAARDVHCALLARDGDLFPNSMVYPPAARRRNRHVNESIQRTFGTTHRGRWPLYCTILASMAAHTTGDPIHDGSTIDNLIYLFILLQPAPPGCGERIKVAFPQIEAVQRQLVDGNAVCLTDPRQCQPVLPPPRRRRHGPG